MSAESVGRYMPSVVTLDDLAAMIAADEHGHRYEISPEGVLSVMQPPDSEHAAIASKLLVWLAMAGWPAEQVLQAGVRGGRRDDQAAGICRGWHTPVLDRRPRRLADGSLHRLDQNGEYAVTTKVPLSWLLNTTPADHLS